MKTTILRKGIVKCDIGSAMTEFSVMLSLMVLVAIPALDSLVFGNSEPPPVGLNDGQTLQRRSFSGLDGNFRLAALAVGGSASTIVIDDTRNDVSRSEEESNGRGAE